MTDTKFSHEHLWVRLEHDGTALVGVSQHAQEQLGDIVFVELPELDAECAQGDEISVIESVKTTSDLIMPVAGRVIAVNETLDEHPEQINDSPLYDGWIMQIELLEPQELNDLMEAEDYRDYVATLDE